MAYVKEKTLYLEARDIKEDSASFVWGHVKVSQAFDNYYAGSFNELMSNAEFDFRVQFEPSEFLLKQFEQIDNAEMLSDVYLWNEQIAVQDAEMIVPFGELFSHGEFFVQEIEDYALTECFKKKYQKLKIKTLQEELNSVERRINKIKVKVICGKQS